MTEPTPQNAADVAPAFSSTRSGLLAVASVIVILAGFKAISGIITPFLLGAFLAIICAPPLVWMQQRRVPGALAVLILFSLVGLGFFLLFLALKDAAESLATQAPMYQARLAQLIDEARAWLDGLGLPIDVALLEIPIPSPATITGLAGTVAGGLGAFTASTFLVLLAFIFFLLEERVLPEKLQAAFPTRRRDRVRIRRFLRSVYQYLLIKTAASVLTGVLVGAGLFFIGVDFALLWGILAGLLNFIPTIGSIIAAVPAVLIALLGLEPSQVLLVIGLYGAVNLLVGNVLEPRFMGSGLGLSPLVVLVSLLLWGFIFGPVGMLLSIPLTMIAKLALEAHRDTRWLGILMSNEVRKRGS
ncbi:Predicted PurR-regulated permease PerM [Ectothiorhodosinus mongolicus]|uniref:Predicted PurR-regulated permease PerM n=1 Tax=Ectothiorhodosinus mongolicus TaxID=233100 RepID=A0A1R3WAH6_9GAMM|nr:AI-2E family transporter [Ectothiorhodosinus mongolicus]ULX57641.1 AI-2E family transporter [Ectothiorhodosinus mongolicus]SIT73248.1 Predicted PurR-regulated permease PerM [Ectothiorhodosinus mongolicus]